MWRERERERERKHRPRIFFLVSSHVFAVHLGFNFLTIFTLFWLVFTHVFTSSLFYRVIFFITIVIYPWLVVLQLVLSVTRRIYFYPKTGFYFRTCEDGAGWHLIPCRISPRSEFFSQAYKNWHIMWGINLGPDWPPLARGSKFHTIHTPTRSLSFLP